MAAAMAVAAMAAVTAAVTTSRSELFRG